jgi:hypothetical protein
MSDDDLTSVEALADGVTAEIEPETASDVAPGSDAPEPTVEELRQQNQRLRANLKGRQQEAERYKSRATELEGLVGSYQRMAPPQPQYQPPVQQGPSDEDLARAEHQAILDGKFEVLADIRRAQRNRTLQEAQQGQVALLTQLGQVAQSNTLTSSYLTRMGIVPNSEQERAFRSRLDEMRRDPEFSDLANSPNALARIAAAEVRADFTGRKVTAREKEREDSAAGAHTESARPATASVPGRAAREQTMYFSEKEMKLLQYAARSDSKDIVTLQKEAWAKLAPAEREKRARNKSVGELFSR